MTDAKQKEWMIKTIWTFFPNIKIFYFGSRFQKNHRSTSDLNLCLQGKTALDRTIWSKLEEELTKGDLSFKVELVDWHRVSDDFRVSIKKKCQEWP